MPKDERMFTMSGNNKGMWCPFKPILCQEGYCHGCQIYLGRIEGGERFPSAHILRKIAKPLGFNEAELLSLTGYLSPSTEPRQFDPYVA